MEKINLKKNQFVVSKSTVDKKLLLKNDGSIHNIGDDFNETFEIFDSLAFAINHAKKVIQENPHLECFIKKYDGKTVYFVDKKGGREINE